MLFQIEIEVKRVGAIPVKKSKGDSIHWLQCDEEAAQKLLQQENHLAIERIGKKSKMGSSALELRPKNSTKGLLTRCPKFSILDILTKILVILIGKIAIFFRKSFIIYKF